MNINISRVKVIVTSPIENADEIRRVVGEAGAGIIGNYTYCSSSEKTMGRFMPNENANPYIGEKNKLEIVEEEKIEFQCELKILKDVLKKIREVHPYEVPLIEIIPLINEEDIIKEA